MAGGKKSGRKAAASAAAHAASKHKTSSVAISAANEAQVRDAIVVSANPCTSMTCDIHARAGAMDAESCQQV